MKKYFDKGLANLSSKAATTASSLFGQHREDVSLTTVDVSQLTPQEAVLQLQSHNSALIARVRQLQGATAENEAYQKQIAELQTHIKELTGESTRKADIYRATQSKHKESLERLQLERDSLEAEVKQSQAEAAKNQALQVELQEARAQLIMARSEPALLAGAEEEWQSLKAELQAQLQSMKQQAAMLPNSAAPGAADVAAARLVEVEAALHDSQRRAAELSTKCGEMQEEIDVLQRQRATALKAAATAGKTQATHGESPVPEESASMQAQGTAAGTRGTPAGASGDGWGFDEDEWDDWGEDANTAAGATPGIGARQDARTKTDAATAPVVADASDVAEEIVVTQDADTSGVADADRRSEQAERVGPVTRAPEALLDPQAVLAYVRSTLGASGDTALDLRRQLEGLLQVDRWDARLRSPSLGPVDLVTEGTGSSRARHSSPADEQLPPADMQVRRLAEQLTPPPQSGCETAPSSLSTIARSPFNATPSRDVTGGAGTGGNVQQDDPGSPAALSFNPLFDESMATPGLPVGEACPDGRARTSHSPDAPQPLLATPLLQWEALKPRQVAAHLRVLKSVSAALECAKSQGGCSPGSTSEQPLAEPQTLQELCDAIRSVEQELVGQVAEVKACVAAAVLPRKLSGLGSESLPRLASQAGASGTPRSPGGSPAASTSIFGLHNTLQELLQAHQGLLDACSGGDAAAQRCRAEMKRLAAEVEAELQRLQELHLQQETEVAIQWREKQQVQSTAQVQMSAKEQELVVFQQQAEMYQAQLADLDAAYEQLMVECQALRAAAQRRPGPAEVSSLADEECAQTAIPDAEDETAEAPVVDASPPAAASAGTDLIQLDSVPVEASLPVAEVLEGEAAVAQGAAEASQGAQSALVERLTLLEEQATALEAQLKAVTSERDMMLVGIGDIEQAAASRLQKAEQLKQELQAARASATTAAAEAEASRQVCREQAAEIATLRSMIEEQQEVLEAGRQGALQLENKVSDLEAALQAAEAQVPAHATADGRAHADYVDDVAARLAAAQQQLEVVTGQLDQSQEAMDMLKVEHQAALAAAFEREEGLQTCVTDAEAALASLREEHASGLARLREEHAGSLEDVRAEARELVKKGTADLQHALKGAQAQLQVARSENSSLQEQQAKMLDHAQAKEAEHAQELSSSQEQVRELEAAAEGRSSTAQREIGRLQSEVEALQGRVERMQKLNKDKKAELETLQAQHSSTRQAQQAAEARADKALKDLAALTARTDASAEKLKQAEAEGKELADVRAKLKKAASSTPDAPLMQQVQALCAAAQQAAKLQQEAKTLRTSADEGTVLRGKVTELSSAAAESAAATQLLQGELAQAISDLATARDELQVCKAELARVQKQAKKDRVQFETAMSKHGNYLGSLPQGNLAAWPEAVQSLVQVKVEAAVAKARDALQAHAMTALQEADAERSVLQQELQQAAGRASELEAGSRESEGQAQQLRDELRAQEAALQEQISALQLRLERAAAAHSHMQGSDDNMKQQLRDVEAHRDELEAEVASLRQEVEGARMVEWAGRQLVEHEANEGHASKDSEIYATRAAHNSPDRLNGHNGEEQPQRITSPHVSSGVDTEALVDYWKQMYSEVSARLQELQKEMSLVQMDLDDERHVHDLRSLADSARKLEIQELQAVQGRADLNVEYLKNVLLGFFESGELPLNKQVLIVLDRLMLFTPQDRARIWKTEAKTQKAGWVSSLFK